MTAAVSIFLVALISVIVWKPVGQFLAPPKGNVPEHRSTAPPAQPPAESDLKALLERSQNLERSLRQTRPNEFVWNTTRQALVYRIADVDQKLNQVGVERDQYSPEFRELLQRRIELMDSLLVVQKSPETVVF